VATEEPQVLTVGNCKHVKRLSIRIKARILANPISKFSSGSSRLSATSSDGEVAPTIYLKENEDLNAHIELINQLSFKKVIKSSTVFTLFAYFFGLNNLKPINRVYYFYIFL